MFLGPEITLWHSQVCDLRLLVLRNLKAAETENHQTDLRRKLRWWFYERVPIIYLGVMGTIVFRVLHDGYIMADKTVEILLTEVVDLWHEPFPLCDMRRTGNQQRSNQFI